MEIASSAEESGSSSRNDGRCFPDGVSSLLDPPPDSSSSSSAASASSPSLPPGNPSSPQRNRYEEDDDEGDVCRICRTPGDAESPLRYPCACSGTIRFVHQDCLLQWLKRRKSYYCEVCKHPFSFSPVYAENAPRRLPFQEFVAGMAMKAVHVLQFFIRPAIVLSVWLLIIPFITFWIWSLTFMRSFREARVLFMSRFSATLILKDCLHGFFISASITFILTGADLLRDYFRHFREFGGHDGEREGENQERLGARARGRPAAPPNRVNAGDANVEDAVEAQEMAGAGQIILRNADNVAAFIEMQVARIEAFLEQMLDRLEGAEDVRFDEFVGLQGPLFHLVENASSLLASYATFLGFVIFIPFSLGRLILFYLSRFISASCSPLLSTVWPITKSAFTLANIILENALTAVRNLSSEGHSSRLTGHFAERAIESVKNNSSMNEALSKISRTTDGITGTSLGSSHLSDAMTLAVGYVLIFSLVLVYLAFRAFIRYTRGESLTFRRLFCTTSIAEAVPSLIRLFLAGMKYIVTMIKVVFLLVIELGVFPLMCGWWLDICTLNMFGATISQRVEFFSVAPFAGFLIHWLIGIMYMLQISIFVSLLRGVLRNGVLYFIRDPADPNFNPFRDLIDDPVHKHACRVLLSVVVCGSLIVLLVFLPVKLTMQLVPSMFPLDVSIAGTFADIPADMLLFQMCITIAIEYFKPGATIKALLRQWFSAVSWALDLSDYLLPRSDDNNRQENVNAEPARHERFIEARHGVAQENPGLITGDIVRNIDIVEDSGIDDQEDNKYFFVFRIILLLILAWMTLLLFNFAVVVLPISLGRLLLNVIPSPVVTHGIKCNDLYAFHLGCYIIWAIMAGIRCSVEYVRTQRARLLLSQIGKWCTIVLKSFALLSIWVFVIPVLIGLLFELSVIVPIRVPVNESPVFLIFQDWALGLVFLQIWMKLVMLDQIAPLVDESWRIKFARVKEDGFSRLQGFWVLREIVIPIVSKLLTALCVPYVFAKGIFPVLGLPLIVNSAVYRFTWLGCLLISVMRFCSKRFHIWFRNLHNSIRDDRYLIGRRLHNFGEDT